MCNTGLIILILNYLCRRERNGTWEKRFLTLPNKSLTGPVPTQLVVQAFALLIGRYVVLEGLATLVVIQIKKLTVVVVVPTLKLPLLLILPQVLLLPLLLLS